MNEQPKKPKTRAGKLLKGVGKILPGVAKLALGTIAPQSKLLQTVSGLLKGAVTSVPPVAMLRDLLDVNGDGKIDFKDIKAMTLEDLVKIVTVVGLTTAGVYYGIQL